MRNITTALILAIAYFITGRLGLMLPAFGTTVTLLWLPTGIAVAALVRWGYGCWPGIWLGALAVNLAVGTAWPAALGISVGNTLGSLFAAWLLRRTGFHQAFDRARDILLLAGAAAAGMAVTASMGVAILAAAGWLPAGAGLAWLVWWAGDVMGVISMAPLLFTFSRREARAILSRRTEFLLWIWATGLATWFVFVLNRSRDGHDALALAFVPLPFVAWAALRFGAVGTSLGLIALSVGAVYGTAMGRGPFFRPDPAEQVALLWVFMATSAVLGWLISTLQAALHQSEEHLRMIVELEPECVKLLSLEGTLLEMNPAGLAMLEASSIEEVRGHPVSGIIVPEHRAAFAEMHRRVMQGESGRCEFTIVGLKGTRRWMETHAVPYRNARREIVGLLGITRDITQRKAAAAALESSLSTLQLFMDTVPAYISLVDAGERYRLVNRRYEEYFGQPAERLVGQRLCDVQPPAAYAEMQPHVRAALAGQTVRYQSNPTSPTGKSHWFDVQYVPRRGEDGTVAGFFVLVFDIGEQKAAEEALRRSEESFRSLTANLPDVVVRFDRQRRHVYANPAVLTATGLPPEAFIGKTNEELGMPEENTAVWKATLERVFATGKNERLEFSYPGPSGKKYWESQVVAERGGDGAVESALVLSREITDRRQSEERSAGELAVLESLAIGAPLAEVLTRLARNCEALFPGMLCSVLLMDAEGRHLRHGAAPSLPEAFCRAVDGIEIGPQVGSCGTAAFTRQTTLVADIATDPLWKDGRDLALAHGLRACWSVPLISSQDRVLGTLALYYGAPASPRPEEVAGIERGAHFASLAIERHNLLRSLQESQVRLETLVSNLPGMAYRRQNDDRWTMTYVSEGCEAITGYQRDELEKNRVIAYADLVHPDDRDRLWKGCRDSFAACIACQEEYRLLDRHGRERWISDRAAGVHGDDGTLLFIDGFIQDITAARQAKLDRERLDRKVQETQKLESLGVLAGGIAHDFNNLLTSVLGNASIAAMDLPPGSPVQDCITQITEASLRAADLCKQMLAYSGRGRFVVQTLDLGQLVEQTAQMLQISISKKAVLRFRLEKDLPQIEADATQIRQVIMNLVINASEAIGDRSGVISLSTGLTRVDRAYLAGTLMDSNLPEGEYVYLEVSDNGNGMSAETQAKIFDPFFTTKFTGRGLGLAAVLGIVRGHKGALKVYSEPDRGTTFKLLFPAAGGPGETAAALPATVHTWRGEGTVLVVDDEETVRSTVARMLRMHGLEPVLVADGREALEVFRAAPGRFALVLLDLTMPHMDGEQTFTEFRRLRPDIRVVLMSGFNAQEAMVRFTGKGLASFLQKPFTIDALRTVLQNVLE